MGNSKRISCCRKTTNEKFFFCRLRNTQKLLILNQRNSSTGTKKETRRDNDGADDDETHNSIKRTFASSSSSSFMFIVLRSDRKLLLFSGLAVQGKPQNRPHPIKKYHNNDDGIGNESFESNTNFVFFCETQRRENANLRIPQTDTTQHNTANELFGMRKCLSLSPSDNGMDTKCTAALDGT